MKTGKVAEPSGIVIKTIWSAGKEIDKSITNLADRIIKEGHIRSDWNLLYTVSLYKGKGDALSRDNYRSLKMLEKVIAIIEQVLDSLIRFQVDTTDIIIMLCQLQGKHLGKHKPLYFALVNLEKAHNCVAMKVL